MYYRRKLFTYEDDAVADFQSFVSPEAFTLPSQYADYGLTVDLYAIYHAYSNVNKKLIYEFTSEINTLVLPAVTGVSYRWAETIGGVDYVTDIASGTAFTAGSTNRYVIVNNTSAAQLTIILPLGSIWSYLSNKINNVSSRYNTYLQYVFCESLLSLTTFIFGAFGNGTKITGTLNISEAVTSLTRNAFSSCSFLNEKLIFKSNISAIELYVFSDTNFTDVEMHPLTAPTCVEGFTPSSKKLHIKAGATGYNVPQWTTTHIFSQIIQDL